MGRTHTPDEGTRPPPRRRPRCLTPQPPFATLNRRLRQAYNLKPRNACYDFCAHYWCMSCALCQEARELKIRGATPECPALYPGLHSAVTVVAPAQATMDLEQPANGIPAPQFADPEKPWKK